MGLIARAIEAEGIPTLSLSSARDITRAVAPPRAAYLDYPLGHTSGKAHEPQLNLQILRDTFSAFDSLAVPGSMAHLSQRWAETDDWKFKVFAPASGSFASAADLPECAVPDGPASDGPKSDGPASASEAAKPAVPYEDDRVARHSTPQYQTEADAQAARASHDGEDCLVCAGIDY